MVVWAALFLTGQDRIVSTAEAAEPSTPVQVKTTRYWDCCKPSGAWPGKASLVNNRPVTTCAKDGKTVVDPNTKNGCDGGSSYMCASQQPWSVDETTAYAFAAANISGKSESDLLCACYKLTLTSSSASGKNLIVQVIGMASDLGSGHFDLLIPGGGVGIFNGCTSQYNAPNDGWGARYGGVSSASQCAQLPAALQPGCNWRFNWLQNADNPNAKATRVKCPAALTAKTSCTRTDDSGYSAP